MKSPACAKLCVFLLLAGCGAMRHGPATHVVSKTTHVDNTMVSPVRDITTGTAEIDRQTVQEVRLRDAEGREWTETNVVNTERVPLARIEAELFEEALRASDEQKQ